MRMFLPDEYLTSVVAVDFDELARRGYRNALVDLDNTVLARKTDVVPKEIVEHFERGKEAGFSFCLLTNNWHERCYLGAKQLDMPLVTGALKPLPHAFGRALARMGFQKDETVMIGDQLFTDVLGAHIVGLRAIMVLPLGEYELPHTRVMRKLERRFLGNLTPKR